MKTLKETKAIALKVTSAFEGTSNNYGVLAGNFDGMGFSFGLFQFNLGQGTLQKLIKDMHKLDPQTFQKCVTVYVAHYQREIDLTSTALTLASLPAKEAVAWAKERQNNNRPDEHWKAAFKNLGAQPQFQKIQEDYAKPYADKAVVMCRDYELYTVRAFCLFFDCCIQQGSLKTSSRARALAMGIKRANYVEKLTILAQCMSTQARTQYQQDVLSRRLCITQGKGKVHGTNWDLTKSFGLTDETIAELALPPKSIKDRLLGFFKRTK